MNYRSIKWIIFTALSLTVPTVFFLFVVVMFVPAIFYVAGIGYVIPKIFTSGHFGESLGFIAILGVHGLIYFGLYYGVSIIVAKLISLIKGRLLRSCIVGVICLGLVFLTQFPVYGGGGHGPTYQYTLSQLFGELNKSYGTGAVQIVYGAAILLLFGILLYPKFKNMKTSRN